MSQQATAEPRLRAIKPADHPEVLALNQASVNELSPLDEERLELLLSYTVDAVAVESDCAVVAFALVMEAGHPYDSANYRYFAERRQDFNYLDRVVVSSKMRRRGIGNLIYDHVEKQAASRGHGLVLEINMQPANPKSLAFHQSRGYTEIAQLQLTPDKRVGLFEKSREAILSQKPLTN